MPEQLLVDVEAELAAFLRTHGSLTPLHGGRVFGAIPAEQADWPILTVRRVGGGLTGMTGPEDLPLVQVDCWADLDDTDAAGTASLLARTVVLALNDLTGALQGAQVAALVPLADPDTARERVSLTVELAAYPQEP